jgi:putative ABC transport system permease protein
MLQTLNQDIRYAFRTLRQSPGFTLVAILTLALGIGANTTIFSVINAVLLRPLPYSNPDRLVMLAEHWPAFPILSVSYQNYKDFRDQSSSYETVAAIQSINYTLTGSNEPERVDGLMISASLLPMLGIQPIAGRTILPDDDRVGGAPVALISYALWQRRFAANNDVLGKSITLDNNPYTVIGVLPARFQILKSADVYLPFEPWAHTLPDDRSWHTGIRPLARLKNGATLQQASNELQTIAKRLEHQYPETNTNVEALVLPLHGQMVSNVRPALLTLLVAVGLVLLIACANVANLLLARATQREKEVAIRTALGASRGRIVRQLLTESILLSLAGGALGLALAALSLDSLLHLAVASVPRAEGIGLDPTVLAFTAGLAILTGILFGLAPAFQSSRLDIRDQLNQSGRGSSSGGHHQRLRSILVVAEVAISMVLLIGAGLLIRSFARLQAVEPGFHPDHILLADVPISLTVYAKPEQQVAFFDRLMERLRALPGVKSVSAANTPPVSGQGAVIHFNIQGRAPKTPNDYIMAGYRVVGPGYFETLGIPLLAGRSIEQRDSLTAPSVVVLNQAMARKFFPGENPLGKHLQIGETPDTSIPFMEVVGVVGDVKQKLESDAKEEMYVPYMQPVLPLFGLTVALRTSSDPTAMTSALRSAILEVDKNQPLVNVRTMEQSISSSLDEQRFRTLLLGLLAGLALVLSAIGVYGVMSYSVSLRTQEIGIRVALGAQWRDIFSLVIARGFALVGAGILIGGVASWLLARLINQFLFGIHAGDPTTFVGVALMLLVVAFLACYFPARRATRVDPIVALRYE